MSFKRLGKSRKEKLQCSFYFDSENEKVKVLVSKTNEIELDAEVIDERVLELPRETLKCSEVDEDSVRHLKRLLEMCFEGSYPSKKQREFLRKVRNIDVVGDAYKNACSSLECVCPIAMTFGCVYSLDMDLENKFYDSLISTMKDVISPQKVSQLLYEYSERKEMEKEVKERIGGN